MTNEIVYESCSNCKSTDWTARNDDYCTGCEKEYWAAWKQTMLFSWESNPQQTYVDSILRSYGI